MLDDRHRRAGLSVEFGDEFVGGVGVGDVVVGELLSLRLERRRHARARLGTEIEGGGLVRILAIAQRAREFAAERAPVRRGLVRLAREPVGNRGIVGGRARKSLLRHPPAEAAPGRAALRVQLRQERVIVRHVDDREDVAVVLGRGADHRGAADVDILDHFVERRAAAQRVLERIEIDDEQVDRRDAVGDHRGEMRGIVADREQAAMHARMQGLQPPVHHLGEAGQRPDVQDRNAASSERRRRASGGDDLDAPPRQRAAEFDETGLVGNGDQSATDRRQIDAHFTGLAELKRNLRGPYHALQRFGTVFGGRGAPSPLAGEGGA